MEKINRDEDIFVFEEGNQKQSSESEDIQLSIEVQKRVMFEGECEGKIPCKIEGIPILKKERLFGRFDPRLQDGVDEFGPFMYVQHTIDTSEFSAEETKRISRLGIIDPRQPNDKLLPSASAMRPERKFNLKDDRYKESDIDSAIPDYLIESDKATRGELKLEILREATINSRINGKTAFRKMQFIDARSNKITVMNLSAINKTYSRMN